MFNLIKYITLIFTFSFLSAQDCVDDATGAFGGMGWSCDMVINTMGQGCDATFVGIIVADECPVTCDNCPADCDANGETSHGCCLPDNNLYIAENGSVRYNSSYVIGGFQFTVNGAIPIGVSGGDAAANEFTIEASAETGIVLGFSLSGTTIPAGCGKLVVVELDGTPTDLSDLVMSDSDGGALDFSYYGAAEPVLGCMDGGDTDYSYTFGDEPDGIEACNYNPDATVDENWGALCEYPGSANYPGCDCAGNVEDCAGVCGGTAVIDECGVCGGSGPPANFDCDGNCISNCEFDCFGILYGTGLVDECYQCIDCSNYTGDCTTHPAWNASCTDCNGELGGAAFIDACSDCVGGTTYEDTDGDGEYDIGETMPITACLYDCSQNNISPPPIPFSYDNCDVCDNIPGNDCGVDCNGDWGGYAVIDNCGHCVLGETGQQPCAPDCSGNWGGDLVNDQCGICGGNDSVCSDECGVPYGDNSTCSDECGVPNGDSTSCADCAGVPNGDSYEDNCNVCDNDPFNDCVQDCDGTWGGSLVDDDCGICGGNNNTCTDCAGVPNGDNVVDNCNVCDNDPSNDCERDCRGIWCIEGTEGCLVGVGNICSASNLPGCDECGTCGGSNTNQNDCCEDMDCAGLCFGDFFYELLTNDECGICGGDGSSCESNCDSAVCMNIENVNTSNGTLNIYMTNQSACSYCEDATYNNTYNSWPIQKEYCERVDVGNSTWIVNTGLSESECASIPSSTDTGGWWFDGYIGGLQLFMTGIRVTSISGGTTDEWFNLVSVNSNADCDADGITDAGCNLIMATSMTGQSIPPGTDELLMTIDFEDFNGTGICFAGTETEAGGNWSPPVASDANGEQVLVDWGSCYCTTGEDLGCGCGEGVPDCTGACGNAVIDECGICDGVGLPEGYCDCDGNMYDCAGECNGDALLDECGVCDGDNSTCSDCAGVPNGDNVADMCGYCDNDSSNDCVQDCAGTWGGSLVDDYCGICGGDGSSCESNCDAAVCMNIANVDLEDYACSNGSITNETACDAVGVCSATQHTIKADCIADGTCSDASGTCSDGVSTLQAYCVADGTCSNTQYTTKSLCENNSQTWTSTYTWTLTYSDLASCEGASATWASTNTWTQTNTWSAPGTLEIEMSNNVAGCSSCDDAIYNSQAICEYDGGNWSFDTSIDAETCSGVCTNSLGDVSHYQNEYACTQVTGLTSWGLCSNLSIVTQSSCVNNGETWEDNTWTDSELNGIWYSGEVRGFQIILNGIAISEVSGGLAEAAGLSFINSDSMIISYSVSDPTPLVTGSGTLVEVTFTDFDADGICFGNDTSCNGSHANVMSDPFGECVNSEWGRCYCTTGNDLGCGCGEDAPDCAGVCGGSGVTNTAGNGECCATGAIDCNNVCDGPAQEDCTGICGGTTAYDCAGVCGGSAQLDECGICGGPGIPEGACDCVGNVEDNCGVCDGDNTCSGCTDETSHNYDPNVIIDDGSCIYGPDIISIYDAPQDQGGLVFLNWSKNTLDSLPDNIITHYSIYRFLPNQRGWEYLNEVPAIGLDSYGYVAPTIQTSPSDSSEIFYTTYLINAHFDGDLYATLPDSGYSIDNLSPSVPDSVYAYSAYSNGITVHLSWAEPLDEDFQYFSLFRDGDLIGYITENTYNDEPISTNNEVAYHLTATDLHGNESEASEPLLVQLTVEMHTGLMHTFANLKSFYVLPEDASVENMFSPLTDQLGAILGEGSAALNMDGMWVGSIQEIDAQSGYWLMMLEEANFSFYGYVVDPGLEYSLHVGSNLISFPSHGSVGLSDGIPDDVEDQFTGIATEGSAAMNMGDMWIGSLTEFEGTKGYWVQVQSELSFSYDLTSLSEDVSRVSTDRAPVGYEYEQSTEQAFYFIEYVYGINPGDWIIAYSGDMVIGARQWAGEIIDVPAMGDDGYDFTKGYMKSGSAPQFKLLSGDKLIDLTGEVPAWSQNQLFMVSNLAPLPESFSLSAAYPNPFNPVTTLSFALPIERNVTLSIYNLQGREVISLVDGNMKAGYHSVVWNADRHSSGVYFVKMFAGEYVKTQKLMLVK